MAVRARRAKSLLLADADGPDWPDARIAEAIPCRIQTIENVRKRLVMKGFEEAVHGKRPAEPPRPKKLDGRQEVEIIALRLGEPPKDINGPFLIYL